MRTYVGKPSVEFVVLDFDCFCLGCGLNIVHLVLVVVKLGVSHKLWVTPKSVWFELISFILHDHVLKLCANRGRLIKIGLRIGLYWTRLCYVVWILLGLNRAMLFVQVKSERTISNLRLDCAYTLTFRAVGPSPTLGCRSCVLI
ncbi:unnamed protein product [Sphenostylis stenocarpa]|uniref:Transmembrane protein n=1 Tax=Sphenostylis stenocarpa TaxID=92480 RepID=A0AA86SWC0_9FABA|nr:unnamed protein product [Sphenostylis stenocarpa]